MDNEKLKLEEQMKKLMANNLVASLMLNQTRTAFKTLSAEYKQLAEQVERMKNCGNCKHDETCGFVLGYQNCDKWQVIDEAIKKHDNKKIGE